MRLTELSEDFLEGEMVEHLKCEHLFRIVDKISANRGYLPGDYNDAIMRTGKPTKVCKNLFPTSEDIIKDREEWPDY